MHRHIQRSGLGSRQVAEMAGDFGLFAVVVLWIDADDGGFLVATTGPTDTGPIAAQCAAAAVLRQHFLALITDGKDFACGLFDPDVEDAVIEEVGELTLADLDRGRTGAILRTTHRTGQS